MRVTGADDSPRVYNPATEWQMRLKATLYSPEDRELAEGERIQFTRSEWDPGIRVGNLATIEQIHDDGGLSVKVDSGASLRLTPEQVQHLEYGYVPCVELVMSHLAKKARSLPKQCERLQRYPVPALLVALCLC